MTSLPTVALDRARRIGVAMLGTMRDDELADRLALAEAVAAPHLQRLGLGDRVPEPGAMQAVPTSAIPDLRLVLLARIATSELATAGSIFGHVRETLARRQPRLDPPDLAIEMALAWQALGPRASGSVGWLRVPLLEPTIRSLELFAGADEPDAVAVLAPGVDPLLDLLATEALTVDASSTAVRMRLLAARIDLDDGPLPSSAWDAGDPFGARMREVVGTDHELAARLAPIARVAVHSVSVLPTGRGARSVARFRADDHPSPNDLARLASVLVAAPLVVRGPGFVTLRPANQRLVRAALWLLAARPTVRTADILGEVGLRMATSGGADNQARDAAVAGTAAALLGGLDDSVAVAELDRLRTRVRNKPVRKQVEAALTAAAERAGRSIDELLDESAPMFGLDPAGRRGFEIGGHHGTILLTDDGGVEVRWASPLPSAERETHAGALAELESRRVEISDWLTDERRRLEGWLRDGRTWPFEVWRRRFVDHPVASVLARRLVWGLLIDDTSSSFRADAEGSLWDADGDPVVPRTDALVDLWHPADADAADISAWVAGLARAAVAQPFDQVERRVYVADQAPDAVGDRRYAGRIVDFHRFRALAGARGWTAPMLGPWDQGDRAVAYRDAPIADIRAEFGQVPEDDQDPRAAVDTALTGTVRFTRRVDGSRVPVAFRDLPVRLVSETLRDVDLFTTVARRGDIAGLD